MEIRNLPAQHLSSAFMPVKRHRQYLPLKGVLPAISGPSMQIWTVTYVIWTMRHESHDPTGCLNAPVTREWSHSDESHGLSVIP